MRTLVYISFIHLIVTCFSSDICSKPYPWLDNYNDSNSIENRIPPIDGYRRTDAIQNSFTKWLRRLPLKDENAKVYLYNGEEKSNKVAHAVIDIDTGDKDLQQCADAVIRFRAEYLFSQNKLDDIQFNFTNGDTASFRQWIKGYRPAVNGNNVNWEKTNSIDSSYTSFRDYLNTIFMYCGTYSLSKELVPVKDTRDIQAGDIFIQGGFPGHAIIVLDIIENNKKNKAFLLAQGFTPAQDIHILKNPDNSQLSPWYDNDFGEILRTPEWTFKKTDLKRFK